jgi:RES domain-containing protein
MHEHPRFIDLLRAIKSARKMVGPWEGRVFRAVELQWARPEYLISGEGTRKHGGRWMYARIAPVAHAAMTEDLAIKESRRAFHYYGISKPRNNPRVSVEIEVKFKRVLQLSEVENVFPGLTCEELLLEDWEKLNGKGRETLAQAIGRAAWKAGLEGMVVPSSRDISNQNLIWFPDNLRAGSECSISGQHQLEKWIAESHADLHVLD